MSLTKTAKTLTYGEAYVKMKESMSMRNSKFIAEKLESHAPKMKRKEALLYYAEKFRNYWNTSEFKTLKKRKNSRKIQYTNCIIEKDCQSGMSA